MLGRKGKRIHKRMCEYACECATDAYSHIRILAHWHIRMCEYTNVRICIQLDGRPYGHLDVCQYLHQNGNNDSMPTFIKAWYSSFNRWTHSSPSLGPAFVFSSGIEASCFRVASSTMFVYLLSFTLHTVEYLSPLPKGIWYRSGHRKHSQQAIVPNIAALLQLRQTLFLRSP